MTKISPIHAKLNLKDLPFLFNATQRFHVILLARGPVCARFCHFSSIQRFSVKFFARGPAFSDTASPFLSQEGQLGICSWYFIDNIENNYFVIIWLAIRNDLWSVCKGLYWIDHENGHTLFIFVLWNFYHIMSHEIRCRIANWDD